MNKVLSKFEKLFPLFWDTGSNLLGNMDATDFLNILEGDTRRFRLALLDPPYNRLTKFHHYNDSLNRDTWTTMFSEHCLRISDLLWGVGVHWYGNSR